MARAGQFPNVLYHLRSVAAHGSFDLPRRPACIVIDSPRVPASPLGYLISIGGGAFSSAYDIQALSAVFCEKIKTIVSILGDQRSSLIATWPSAMIAMA